MLGACIGHCHATCKRHVVLLKNAIYHEHYIIEWDIASSNLNRSVMSLPK